MRTSWHLTSQPVLCPLHAGDEPAEVRCLLLDLFNKYEVHFRERGKLKARLKVAHRNALMSELDTFDNMSWRLMEQVMEAAVRELTTCGSRAVREVTTPLLAAVVTTPLLAAVREVPTQVLHGLPSRGTAQRDVAAAAPAVVDVGEGGHTAHECETRSHGDGGAAAVGPMSAPTGAMLPGARGAQACLPPLSE
jgi:hypothetical protein